MFVTMCSGAGPPKQSALTVGGSRSDVTARRQRASLINMSFAALPAIAAWQHQDARAGFEVVFFRITEDRYLIEGCTTAVEDRTAWVVEYAIELDSTGSTRTARIFGRSDAGPRSRTLEADGRGGWQVDGLPAPALDGCLDVDLESSAMTNALPVRRLSLPAGTQAEAPSAYVRAVDLTVERLEQTYARLPDGRDVQRYDYAAPQFEFACQLEYDESGLVSHYPGIAIRAY